MVIADKYRYYQQECRRIKIQDGVTKEKVVYLTKDNTEKTVEGHVLDAIGVKKQCCRRHFLTHVDI